MRTDETIPTASGRMSAVVLRPDGPAPQTGWPAVIVLYEVFGTRPEMVAAAQRFADDGYLAVLPDVLGGTGLRCLARAMREIAAGRPGAVTANVESTRAWLAARSDVDGRRLGVAGFCMGGGFALLYAGTGPSGVRAAGVNYGAIPKDDDALRGACPVVASYGGRDRALGAKGAGLGDRLCALGVANDVHVYPEAGHSFMTQGHHPLAELLLVPLHPGYAPGAAADAWRRMLRFFDQHVRRGGESDANSPPPADGIADGNS